MRNSLYIILPVLMAFSSCDTVLGSRPRHIPWPLRDTDRISNTMLVSTYNTQVLKGRNSFHTWILERKDINLYVKCDFLWKRSLLNKITDEGNTPLHLAIIAYNKKNIELLINLGADTTIKNNKGKTAFDLLKMKNIELYNYFSNLVN